MAEFPKTVPADPKGVLAGRHFMDGDHALAEGALAAGCRFFAGYPITPSTETAERFAERCPEVGGLFIQMEDEIASITANVGAVWGGQKVMTVTSGPGFSLMMETIGLACMMETPMVLADVQRGGPSTGLPTLTAQQDMMQARWGSPWRLPHHRAGAGFSAGVLRSCHRGLQPLRNLPRPGLHHDRRDSRPYARKGGHSAR